MVYPHLTEQIGNTYAAKSHATLKASLYDSYKLGLRWSSDRIGDRGVVAFVTNASFLRGNTDAGVRACLADEFTEIYVFDLRGNARSSGSFRRKEAGNVFGEGSRAPIALSVLVKDPMHKGPARIHYRDVGDYLTREQKLMQVQKFGSIDGITNQDGWTTLRPDVHHDWFEQRDPSYAVLMPLAIKNERGQTDPPSAFSLFSMGVKTNRDPWLYSFDQTHLWTRVQSMFAFYEERRQSVENGLLSREAAQANDAPSQIKWTVGLRQQLTRNRELRPARHHLRLGSYRPFTLQHLYYDRECIERMSRTPNMFPTADTPNQVIAVTGRGATVPFSSFMVDRIPDLELISKGQCFPRWSYRQVNTDSWVDYNNLDTVVIDNFERTDNITDWCLQQFQDHYGDLSITKDDIWHYIYGVLHATDFRERFTSDLTKDLPRIPFAPNFTAFRNAGTKLADLHLEYETCEPWPVEFQRTGNGPQAWSLTRPMRWLDKATRGSLQVTSQVVMCDIPTEAHDYIVNGRTPLEWAIDRLRSRTDKASGIVNNPNSWFADNPEELGRYLARLVTVSVESARIIRNLPASLHPRR